jgi:hypothetical protein
MPYKPHKKLWKNSETSKMTRDVTVVSYEFKDHIELLTQDQG